MSGSTQTQKRRSIVVLGCTGSIGAQTLDVVLQHSDELRIVGLAVNTRMKDMVKAAQVHHVAHLAVGDASLEHSSKADDIRRVLAHAHGPNGTTPSIELGFGMDAVVNLCRLPEADIVVNALVGAAGLRASFETLKAGKVLALANKESLVVGGDIIMPLAAQVDEQRRKAGLAPAVGPAGALMPIDSEHGAIYQCLLGENTAEVSRLWVTASGGPFRGKTADELRAITPEQALAHPTWNMGRKISIDSSTLMNKGLEVIEAHHLFEMPYDRISVVVQPQSAIHSMVEFTDGSVKAHLGTTDMRIPIQFALSYPQRWQAPVQPLDFTQLGHLDFDAPDTDTFRCLALARAAGQAGGTMPCAMNAANEVAVASFLDSDTIAGCSYLGIADTVEAVMDGHDVQRVTSLEQLEEVDALSRAAAAHYIENHFTRA